jgi:hypothetical protein
MAPKFSRVWKPLRLFEASNSSAYLFLMVTLLIGLPLLTAYEIVNPAFYQVALVPYLVACATIAFLIMRKSQVVDGRIISSRGSGMPSGHKSKNLILKLNSIPPYFALGILTLLVIIFGVFRIIVYSYYPYPPPQIGNLLTGAPTIVDLLGASYIVLLIVAAIIGVSKLVFTSFPLLRKILSEKKYALMATGMSVSFAAVYLLLVNQILVEGLNTPPGIGEVPSPDNIYPYIHVFSLGIQQPFLNMVYIPYATVQFSPSFNLLLVPFELVFTVILSLLVASNVVMAHYLISHSGLACSVKGTVLSTGGSILGLTATCPTCLVPTFVSVIFGGVVAAEAVYSNIYGVVIPPVVSVATLILSIVYLSKTIKKRTFLNGLEA